MSGRGFDCSKSRNCTGNSGNIFFDALPSPLRILDIPLAAGEKQMRIGTFAGAALIGIVENGLYAMAFPYYS